MKFTNFEDLKEKVKFSPDVIETFKQIRESTAVYEKMKELSEDADKMTEDPEQAYIWYSRCIELYKFMDNCDDSEEYLNREEFQSCYNVLEHSFEESSRLGNYLQTVYAEIQKIDRGGITIQFDQLIGYVERTGKTALIIDYRREKFPNDLLSARGSITIVPVDPSLLQQKLDFTQLHYSVDYPHSTTGSEILNFDLVVLMGDKLEDRQATRNLWNALTFYNPTYKLKRDPFLLGDEVKEAEKDAEQLRSKSAALNKQEEVVDLTQIYKIAMELIEKVSSIEQTLPGHVGLYNLGNTCFMNSALQALFHTQEMRELFSEKSFIHQVNPKTKSKSAGKISACFSALMDSVWSGRSKYIKPNFFLNLFANKVDSEFGDRRQHDAQEFFSRLLNALHEETDKVDEKKPFLQDYNGKEIQEDANHYFKNLKLFESSPIQDLFDTTSVMTLTCFACGTSSVTFENMPLLLLELPDENDFHRPLSTCLEHYFGDSVLEGSEKWECPGCKSKQRAERSMRVWSLPPILVICLKRFASQHGQNGTTGELRKNTININFGVNSLDMSQYSHKYSESKIGSHYELYAVTNHKGSLYLGHYNSFVNVQEKEWLKFDDERVSSMRQIDVQTNDAYILYFRKTSM